MTGLFDGKTVFFGVNTGPVYGNMGFFSGDLGKK